MSNTFIVSDTHFNHANILTFANFDGVKTRPEFDSVEAMNEHMVEQWNSVVKDNDVVYHLGDVYFGKFQNEKSNRSLLSRLRGRKYLCLGNHDDPADPVLYEHFKKVTFWNYLKELGVAISHVPLHESTILEARHGKDTLNIHGHIHRNAPPSDRHINVSVEWVNYTPIEITEAIRSKR
jgi:calcineurin-like phosphoesterase family protein